MINQEDIINELTTMIVGYLQHDDMKVLGT